MSLCGRAAPDPHAPVPLDRMVRALAYGGSRPGRPWGGEGVSLGAANGARLGTAAGGIACVFAGHLHNGAEVAAALGQARADDAVALAIGAYRRWGEAFADRLIGDYSVAVWDGAVRRMVLAVSPEESHPIFTWTAPHGELRFASEQAGLFAEADVPRELDERHVAQWLALLLPDRSTFFKGIDRVRGGDALVWEDGRTRSIRWWCPEAVPMLRLAKPEDYHAAVRATFDEAVACRIGTDERVGSFLSGGLDSGAVTALAAGQLARQGRGLTAFTAAPEHGFNFHRPDRFGDEWPHAAKVAAMYPNIEHVRISNDDTPLEEVLERRSATQEVPLFNLSNMVWGSAIERECRDRRISVLLSGQMGNMTFSWDGLMLLPMLARRGRIDKLARALLDIRRVQGWRWLAILGAGGDAVLPPRLARRLRAALGKGEPEFGQYSAAHPDVLRRTGLDAEVRQRGGDLKNLAPADPRAVRLFVARSGTARGDFANGSRRHYGIDQRDPTMDRRLFELCLSIPEDQYLRNGVFRAVARGALAGGLPPEVLNEKRKGLQAADWAVAFDRAVPAFRAEVARLRESGQVPGWIDLDRVEQSLNDWPGVEAAGRVFGSEYLTAVSRALATGRWVRRIEGGNA